MQMCSEDPQQKWPDLSPRIWINDIGRIRLNAWPSDAILCLTVRSVLTVGELQPLLAPDVAEPEGGQDADYDAHTNATIHGALHETATVRNDLAHERFVEAMHGRSFKHG